MVTRLIGYFREHPAWALGWSVFTLCCGYLFATVNALPERATFYSRFVMAADSMHNDAERVSDFVVRYNEAFSNIRQALGVSVQMLAWDEAQVDATAYLSSDATFEVRWLLAVNSFLSVAQVLREARRRTEMTLTRIENRRFDLSMLRQFRSEAIQDLRFLEGTMRDVEYGLYARAASLGDPYGPSFQPLQKNWVALNARMDDLDVRIDRLVAELEVELKEWKARAVRYLVGLSLAVLSVLYVVVFLIIVAKFTYARYRTERRRPGGQSHGVS